MKYPARYQDHLTFQQKGSGDKRPIIQNMITKTDKKELDEALNKISSAKNVIESLALHYRDKFDNLSEKAQEGERGASIDEVASELETMNDSLDEIITTGETLIG